MQSSWAGQFATATQRGTAASGSVDAVVSLTAAFLTAACGGGFPTRRTLATHLQTLAAMGARVERDEG